MSPWVQQLLANAIVANLPSRERCAAAAAELARGAMVAVHRTLTLLATGSPEEKSQEKKP